MNNTALVNLKVDFALFYFSYSFSNIHSYSATLGVRHQSTRTEHTTECTNLTHDGRHSDNHINISPSTFDLFNIFVKTPPVAIQLLEVTKQKSGSAEPNRKKVAEITWEQVRTIAQDKMVDLNCFTVEAAMKMVAGTARSMGIAVKGEFPVNN